MAMPYKEKWNKLAKRQRKEKEERHIKASLLNRSRAWCRSRSQFFVMHQLLLVLLGNALVHLL